ncbi:hypothetical protein NQ314_001136, partial [Rhamnusium bicolor]
DNQEQKEIFVCKPKKRKQLRQRIKTDESDEDDTVEQVSSKLNEMKEIQKLRGRPNGVSIVGLALGTKVALEDEMVAKDPFNVKAGGMVNMQALKSGKMKQVDDAYDTGIGTQFSVETNKRDEDEEMMKFIEEELSKRKGKSDKVDEQEETINKGSSYLSPEEAALRSEEMLSNQMLSGIPEVDLGIEAKIKNIEATEEAKLRLLWEKQNKKRWSHNRFNIDQSEIPKKKTKIEADRGEAEKER